ncbi:lysophospholipid acyltransferase family protein [Arcanobacterium wilhelmae]|uniref:lysophospholipid acyltransferase family protein n=1 Tax=Arcanobacterium wilhelmae TaxID=1803177 RepID=UPI0024151629|nr:lysophospholipid acyltransferase family protein [Arcanobacterium wilhelmae]WFN90509.1 lysophospholipid acyltransferase family protein [Arcanobacterium wilhelmae]
MSENQPRKLHPLDDYHSGSKRNQRKAVRKLLTRPVINTLLNATVWGAQNVEGLEGAYICVGNHSSHLDAPMVFSLLPEFMAERIATGAAADYFYRRKGISKLTSMFFNTYPIERKGKYHGPNAGRAAGMTGRLLRDGVPILIFPEGTRSRTGQMGQFKPGAAALAMKTHVPIVPLGLAGGHDAMPVGRVLPKFGRPPVSLYIGKPMWPLEGEAPEDFMARVRAHIVAMLDKRSANPEMLPENGEQAESAGPAGEE